MAQIFEYISIAIMNIRHNKGRSVLTMLGIIIGISSVIMVISIGNGVREEISGELNNLMGGQIDVYVDRTRKDTTVVFGEEDLDTLMKEVDHLKGVSPYFTAWGTAVAPKTTIDLMMYGGTPSYMYNSKEPMLKGRYYNDADLAAGNAVCVIEEEQAKKLFGTSDVVGLSFEATVYGMSQELKIIGVRKASSSKIMSLISGGSFVTVEVPYTLMGNKFGLYTDEITSITLYIDDSLYITETAKQAKMLLESRHHCLGENQITVSNYQDETETFDTIITAITAFVSLVAAISLLVGGIGVMNIMLVSVTERTREIGIRKALGARTNSIMWQFLAEAGIITLLGGIIGIILGVTGAFGVCAIISINVSVSIQTIIITTLFSCGVGIFFGIYPAKKAAKLSPIEALRHE